MPFVIEQDPGHARERLEFIGHAELSAIRMVNFSASRARALPEAEQLQLSMNHRTEAVQSPPGRQLFHVEIEVRSAAGETAEPVFEAKTRFELEYTLSDGYEPPEAHVQAFMEGNAVFHCWPFFREFVQSSTQRMGLTVPPMPMLVLTTRPAVQTPAARRKKPTAAGEGPMRQPRRAGSVREKPAR